MVFVDVFGEKELGVVIHKNLLHRALKTHYQQGGL
jgi:hypothetical protein